MRLTLVFLCLHAPHAVDILRGLCEDVGEVTSESPGDGRGIRSRDMICVALQRLLSCIGIIIAVLNLSMFRLKMSGLRASFTMVRWTE